jgi:hypothetical protein
MANDQMRLSGYDRPIGAQVNVAVRCCRQRRLADAAERLPPWQTVYWWFRRIMRQLPFRTVHEVALMIDR